MSYAELLLTYAAVILQMSLLVTLLVRAQYKRFPAFVALTAYSVASTIALLAARNSPVTYLWVYWTSDAGNTLIVFLALHEIFRTVFHNFYRMPWFRWLFPGVGVVMAMVAVLRSVLHPMSVGSRVYAIIISLEIAMEFLQMGIFALFIVLARFFRVRYPRHTFGLALGFGLISGGWLVVYILRSEFGTQFDYVVRIVSPVTYTLGLVVWLATFLIQQPVVPQPGKVPGLTPEEMLSELKRYTAAAKRTFRH